MDILGFLPSFGSAIFTIGAFIVALSVIVAIHEYGHYIVGRWSGIKAEVFSIGFGPVLWSRQDRHGTRWQIAALPFGGYVKFLGDSNAASAKDGETMEELSKDDLRHSMHGAPLWARALTVAAGPAFNFLLSFLIFAAVALGAGVARDPLTVERIYELPDTLPIGAALLEPGDALLAIEGKSIEDDDFADFLAARPSVSALSYTVLRGGREVEVTGPPLSPTRVAFVNPDSAALEAGLAEGDVILSINRQIVVRFNDMIAIVNGSQGAPITLVVWRAGEEFEVTLSPRRRDLPLPDNSFETRWIMGVSGAYFFEPQLETPGLAEAVVFGFERVVSFVTLTISGLYHMITGAISSCGVSGPIGIAQMSGTAASQGATSFIMFIGLLSTAVGLLNLFPVPVLDGGHLVFYAYEAATGKPPSDKVLRVLMAVGLTALLALMAFALTNDLFCP
ncbi:MAG: RIP metalloprotease RseP [Halocynthiibacter sp.]